MALTKEDVRRIYDDAQSEYCCDEIELDDIEHYEVDSPPASRFSEGDDGVWIQAWLWVPNPTEDG